MILHDNLCYCLKAKDGMHNDNLMGLISLLIYIVYKMN